LALPGFKFFFVKLNSQELIHGDVESFVQVQNILSPWDSRHPAFGLEGPPIRASAPQLGGF
jgi:hypothetical protein